MEQEFPSNGSDHAVEFSLAVGPNSGGEGVAPSFYEQMVRSIGDRGGAVNAWTDGEPEVQPELGSDKEQQPEPEPDGELDDPGLGLTDEEDPDFLSLIHI